MGSVSPKMDEALPLHDDGEEEDMTSIMSAEQRNALQEAAKTEKDAATLERETAKPPPSDARPMAIPRAAAIPAEARPVSEAKIHIEVSEEPEPPPAPEPVPAPRVASKPVPAGPAATPATAVKDPGWATWELVAFVLLAVSIVVALRG